MENIEVREQIKSDLYRRFSDQGVMKSRLAKTVRGNRWRAFILLAGIAKRAVDLTLAGLLLLLTAPLFAAALLPAVSRSGHKIHSSPRVGRFAEVFPLLSFNLRNNIFGKVFRQLGLHRLPVLFNILKGDLSFIGPRAAAPDKLDLRETAARRRLDARPGLLCLWWIRQRANIDYGSEFESDTEYVNTSSVFNDLGIAARALPAMFYGGPESFAAPDEIKILGIPVKNSTMTEAVEMIADRLGAPPPTTTTTTTTETAAAQFCFVNADCANLAARNADYKSVLCRAGTVFADGIGMKLAGKLLNTGIRQNVNGTDLFPRLCEKLAGTGKRIFLLGAKPEIAEAVRGWAAENYPQTIICGTQHGYFSIEEQAAVIRRINEAGTDLLLVAFGAPRQDLWIAENLPLLKVKAAIGVGGLFDYFSGRIPRAPQWVREIGFEWLFRFYQEPRRMFRRYFVGNFEFLVRVAVLKLRNKT